MAQPAAAPDTGFPGTNNALAGERMKGQTWDTRRSSSTPRCRRGRRGRLSRCSSRCRASERELGCQWLPARPTTGGRGPPPPPLSGSAQLSRKKKGKSDHQDDPPQEVPHELALLPLEEAAQVLGLGVPVGTAPLLCGLPLFSMFRPLVVCFPVSAARCCHQVSSKHGRSVVGRGGNGSRCRRR